MCRESDDGKPELIAEGYERQVPMALEAAWRRARAGRSGAWWCVPCAMPRRLRRPFAPVWRKAQAQVEALNQRGRGRKRFEEIDDVAPSRPRRLSSAIKSKTSYGCATINSARRAPCERTGIERRGARSSAKPRLKCEWTRKRLTAAVGRLGWRVYGTNQPREQLSLEQAVLAYRSEYLVERSLGRLKGRPLSLTPMYVQRDDHATGLIRLLSIALRVLTLLEFVGRRHLALEKGKMAGLYAGNPKRETARPTAERLLEAFQDITLTVIELPQQTIRHVTPLSPVQLRILEILGFSSEVYTKLGGHFC